MSDELRLGDVIDDYCAKCRRLTNHAIVSMMDGQVAKVRCRSCYHEHTYLHEQIPPSKKDLKKMELFNEVLAKVDPSAEVAEGEPVEEAEVTAPATDEAPSEAAAKKKPGRTKKA
jgi:hypothetical protein